MLNNLIKNLTSINIEDYYWYLLKKKKKKIITGSKKNNVSNPNNVSNVTDIKFLTPDSEDSGVILDDSFNTLKLEAN